MFLLFQHVLFFYSFIFTHEFFNDFFGIRSAYKTIYIFRGFLSLFRSYPQIVHQENLSKNSSVFRLRTTDTFLKFSQQHYKHYSWSHQEKTRNLMHFNQSSAHLFFHSLDCFYVYVDFSTCFCCSTRMSFINLARFFFLVLDRI